MKPDLIGSRLMSYNIIWNGFWENHFNSLYSKSLVRIMASSKEKNLLLGINSSEPSLKYESDGLYDKKYQNFRLLAFPESFLFSNEILLFVFKRIKFYYEPFWPFHKFWLSQ